MSEYLSASQNFEVDPTVSVMAFYLQFISREIQILTCLNHLLRGGSIVHGFVWSSLSKEDFLESFYGPQISLISEEYLSSPRQLNLQVEQVSMKGLDPPTFVRTNEFTKAFQLIVDMYSIPAYKEVNPGLFTIVSFPFLFGVMYGDVGHGAVLLFFSILLCLFGKSVPALKSLYEARYLLLLSAFFATYCGFIYNDFMSLPLNLFESCWEQVNNKVPVVDSKGKSIGGR